jgi:hypothetical protein
MGMCNADVRERLRDLAKITRFAGLRPSPPFLRRPCALTMHKQAAGTKAGFLAY